MTAPAHYAFGAASALFIQNFIPAKSSQETRMVCAFLAAVVSHVFADTIPHAEHFLRGHYLAIELVAETILMSVVLVGASRSLFMTAIILSGMIGAAIPDGLTMLNRNVDWPILYWINSKIHATHGKLNLFYANLWIQALITALCAYYVRIKSA